LTAPANTTIQAHSHPDDRVAIVISGTWYIGYGSQFDEKKLKALPAGSLSRQAWTILRAPEIPASLSR
jgi:hypothetical protein